MRLHDALAEQSNSPFRSAIVKLIEIVDEENAVLEGRRVVSHAGFTERKNHALRELMARVRAADYDGKRQTILDRSAVPAKALGDSTQVLAEV